MKFLNCKRLKDVLMLIKLINPQAELNNNLMHDFREIPKIESLFEGAIAIDSLELFIQNKNTNRPYIIYQNILKYGAIEIFKYCFGKEKITDNYLVEILLYYQNVNPKIDLFVEIIVNHLEQKNTILFDDVIRNIIRCKNLPLAKFCATNRNHEYLMSLAINDDFLEFVKYLYNLNPNFDFNSIRVSLNRNYIMNFKIFGSSHDNTLIKCPYPYFYFNLSDNMIDYLVPKGFDTRIGDNDELRKI